MKVSNCKSRNMDPTVSVENDVKSGADFISKSWNKDWISLGEQDFKNGGIFRGSDQEIGQIRRGHVLANWANLVLYLT